MKINRLASKPLYLLHNPLHRIIFLLFLLFFFFTFSNSLTAQKAYHKLCSKGFDYENSYQFDDAIAKYNEAIALKPNKWNAYCYKAYVNSKLEKYDDAIADATKAIELAPSKSTLYYLRANCYYEKKSYDKAIADYSVVISKSGSNYNQLYLTYFKRAKAYYNIQKYQESASDITNALSYAAKQNIKADYMYNWRARCYIELGKYNEAIKDYDLYLAAYPNEINSIFYTGYAYYKTGNTDKAKEYALKVTQLDLASEKYYSGKNILSIYDLDKRRKIASSLLAEAQSNIEELKEIQSRALLNIKATEAFQNLDSAWFTCPDISGADANLKDSIKSAFFIVYPKLKDKPEIPENARKYVVQANKSTQEKDYKTALSLWNNALSIAPYNPMGYYNCALLREFLGNYDKAISNMKKYIKLAPDATDARSAQDQIYSWEAKSTSKTITINTFDDDLFKHLRSETFTALGGYTAAFAFGASGGLQLDKNLSLSNYWDMESIALNQTGLIGKYDTTTHIPLSGDFEFLIRPVKRLGIGVFVKTLGGIGTSTKISGDRYHLNMRSNQIGGLARFYMMMGNMREKPDLYLQFNYGTNKLNGYYGVSGSDAIFKYCKTFEGSAPYVGIGFGMGGRIGKVSYLTFSIDYYNSVLDKITYKVTTNKYDTNSYPLLEPENTTGRLSGITAHYNGIVFKLMLLGFCF